MALSQEDLTQIRDLLDEKFRDRDGRLESRLSKLRREIRRDRTQDLRQALERLETRLGRMISANGEAIADLAKRVDRLESGDEPWKG